ncbi:2-dehydro-3-deoxygalactonokinase [Nitratireductor soli]|uniref:2-dehydro-3-deoxygalactonokinase n=1 Tax=Nitratireductor soli TaxID=1670619 RepID=UPI00065E097E|nr:2-dehydro-3-deoxygalactonokinase [Nitratireductor soli]
MTAQNGEARCIVVDWGTTSFRAFLTDDDGAILDSGETADGIGKIGREDFEPLLMRNLEAWLRKWSALPVVCLGMITSRSGWIELPYVPCPADLDALAQGAHQTSLPNGSPLVFLTGLTDRARWPYPDVMRGEETQIAGFGLERDATVVLPGTHSKWARVKDGRITGFQTFVTGEIFALLSQHSFIARSAGQPSSAPVWDAFERGLSFAADERLDAGAFLSMIFSARTGMLAGQLAPPEITDYVSGLVIGCEFRQAREQGWFDPGTAIGIVGNDGLNERYKRAADAFGLRVIDGGEEAAIRGALAILNAVQGASVHAA